MSYYNLGTNCKPATIGLTSNSKFIQPLSNLYNKSKREPVSEHTDKNHKKEKITDASVLKELSNILNNRVEKIKKFNNKSCSGC